VLPTDETDGRATAYSEREREFTFAKNRVGLRVTHSVILFHRRTRTA